MSVFSRNAFFVKEQIQGFRAANSYDVYDPEDLHTPLLEVREDISFMTKVFRYTDYRAMTPFNILVREPDASAPLIVINKGVSFLRASVTVKDAEDRTIGHFQEKNLSVGGAFRLLDHGAQEIGLLKGTWTGREFTFNHGDRELGKVTQKWAGVAQELFTNADNYVVSIDESVAADSEVRKLILAACFCVDMVLKE